MKTTFQVEFDSKINKMTSEDIKEYQQIIEGGVIRWNKWRDDTLGIKPLLSGVDLSSRNLVGISLREVILYSARLSKSNISGELCQYD